MNKKVKFLTHAAAIAALYVVPCYGQEMKDSVQLSEIDVYGKRRTIDEIVSVQRLSGDELTISGEFVDRQTAVVGTPLTF